MRIGDNNPYLSGLAQQRVVTPKPVTDLPQGNQTALPPVVLPPAVEPISDVKKQLLLQSYLSQGNQSGGSLGYSQQRAVEAYNQQAQHPELQQLQVMLGVDEYA